MKVTLIHNPKAGGAAGPNADDLLALIRAAGHHGNYASSQDEHWQTVLKMPADLVAVAGGDGIVGKVARLCIDRNVPLTVLPMGTANNIAQTLGLFDIPLEQLVAGWGTAHCQAFDVGVADGPWGRELFLEGLGTGLFSSALGRLEAEENGNPFQWDDPSQALQAARQFLRDHLQDYPPLALQIRLDDQELSGKFLLMEAMNIRSIGPNLALAPDADPGDGLLDVVIVPADEQDKLIEHLHDNPDTRDLFGFPVRRVKHLRVQGEDLHVHFDDRVWPNDTKSSSMSPIVMEVTLHDVPLRFLVPGR